MDDSLSERRLAENEVFFRQANEHVEKGLRDLAELAKSEGHEDLLLDKGHKVQFYCECSDEKCRKRITLAPSEYRALHKNKDQFVVLPGHNVPEAEKIMVSEKDYMVVEKFVSTPDFADQLHPTDLDHTGESSKE